MPKSALQNLDPSSMYTCVDPIAMSGIIESRYALEDTLMDMVSAGDFSSALKVYHEFLTYKIPPRTDDPIRNEQNMLIILSTLCRKTLSIKNNIHPLYLDDTSTKLAIMINSAKTERDLHEIAREILRKYCILASNTSLRGYSDIVQRVATYIEFHYTEEICLKLMAEKYSVSRTYLSAVFKKDTGSTLTEYLHSVRIRRALFLIHTTTLSMGQIASCCGYADLNYFIRMFKKINGQSPKQYSKQITGDYRK